MFLLWSKSVVIAITLFLQGSAAKLGPRSHRGGPFPPNKHTHGTIVVSGGASGSIRTCQDPPGSILPPELNPRSSPLFSAATSDQRGLSDGETTAHNQKASVAAARFNPEAGPCQLQSRSLAVVPPRSLPGREAQKAGLHKGAPAPCASLQMALVQQLVRCKFTPKFHSNFPVQKSHFV